MSLKTRKLILVFGIVAVVVVANTWGIVAWLDKAGVIDLARYVRREYLTGTAITVILALLILLVPSAGQLMRRCRVCSRLLIGSARYCGRCGSRV
jgi:hypothetical protein